jgi:hypothetical protein
MTAAACAGGTVSHTARRWLALAVQVAALVAICAAYLLVLLHAGPARAQEPPAERVEAVARQRLDCGRTRNVFWRVPRRDA